MTAAADAAAFAATEAIAAGEWDRHLLALWRAVRERRMLTDRSKPPTIPTPERHQVWVWMNGPGAPHWEIRGTGVIFDEDLVPPARRAAMKESRGRKPAGTTP